MQHVALSAAKTLKCTEHALHRCLQTLLSSEVGEFTEEGEDEDTYEGDVCGAEGLSMLLELLSEEKLGLDGANVGMFN